MASHILRGQWVVAFLITALALCIMPAAPAQAGDDDPVDGPVFLILSLEDAFDLPNDISKDDGSETVLVEIGTLTAGDAIYSTRYKTASGVTVTLPKNKQWKKMPDGTYRAI